MGDWLDGWLDWWMDKCKVPFWLLGWFEWVISKNSWAFEYLVTNWWLLLGGLRGMALLEDVTGDRFEVSKASYHFQVFLLFLCGSRLLLQSSATAYFPPSSLFSSDHSHKYALSSLCCFGQNALSQQKQRSYIVVSAWVSFLRYYPFVFNPFFLWVDSSVFQLLYMTLLLQRTDMNKIRAAWHIFMLITLWLLLQNKMLRKNILSW